MMDNHLIDPRGRRTRWTRTALAAALVNSAAMAASISVPNGSFESPTPPPGFPVNPAIDSWQEAPQPSWYDPASAGGVTWDQLSGVFPNPPPESVANHIDNLDGAQAAYLFAVPGVTLFQDYATQAWNDPAPTHAFDATYEVGVAYQLTVGVLGGSGMGDGAGLRISLYYRDGADSLVTVAARDILYSSAEFPTITHLNDYQVTLPMVAAGDPWAGQKIGVSIAAISPGASYWDVDQVRLEAIPEPTTLALLPLGVGALWAVWRRRGRASAG